MRLRFARLAALALAILPRRFDGCARRSSMARASARACASARAFSTAFARAEAPTAFALLFAMCSEAGVVHVQHLSLVVDVNTERYLRWFSIASVCIDAVAIAARHPSRFASSYQDELAGRITSCDSRIDYLLINVLMTYQKSIA